MKLLIFFASVFAIFFGLLLLFIPFLVPPKLAKPTSAFITSTEEEIPKQIFTFWNSSSLPEIIEKSIETWRFHCPDYKITVITPENIDEVLPKEGKKILKLPYANTPQRLSDFVRLKVLYQHGGVWMDASTILFDSLDDVLLPRGEKKEFVGYTIGYTKIPIIESWFFACIKNSPFVGLWKSEFMRLNKYLSAFSYVSHLSLHGVDLSGIPAGLRPYLAIHAAAQTVIQKHEYQISNFELLRSESGPYVHLAKNEWDMQKSVEWLMKQEKINVPFLKFRGNDRRYLESNPAFLAKLLKLSYN